MAQINTTIGDFSGNVQRILEAVAEARSLGVDLITFPELAICGSRGGSKAQCAIQLLRRRYNGSRLS